MHNPKLIDVFVLGAGAAGVAASIAAARLGLSVSLVEQSGFPGGKATAAEVGTICGLYKFSRSANADYAVKGFAKQFAETLQERSKTFPLSNYEGLHYLPYDIGSFKEICQELLDQHKVHVYFNSALASVSIDGNNIKEVLVKTKNGEINLSVRTVIDCSGDSSISQAAKLPVIKSDHYQAAAQVFTLKNVSEQNESRLGMILIKALRSAIDKKELPAFYDRVYIVQGSLKNNSVSLKLGIPIAVTYDPGNIEEIRRSAIDFVGSLTRFLIANVAAFKNASIEHIAPEPGIRIGFRTHGKYVLTEDDVLSCRKFSDAVAIGPWPIEEWEQQKRVKMVYFELDDHYQIPYGCLVSNSIENLYMAGRNISATNGAIASARVIGICLQTGYAAGLLAAGHVMGKQITGTVKTIQEEQL
ncbi:MAG: FAD-dependent oxidoreductase [Ferruginibacter sp.]